MDNSEHSSSSRIPGVSPLNQPSGRFLLQAGHKPQFPATVQTSRRCHAAIRGESSRLILNMLREADGPMTTRDIVLKIMESRGLHAADRAMRETMRTRPRAAVCRAAPLRAEAGA